VEILRDLRLGVYDVIVGINLLREGLDLPEVSLVAILDADKQGFLRSATALIQTIGRASRHVHGTVLMYGEKKTDAMHTAIDETYRRRAIQSDYNHEHGIEPASIIKSVRDITDRIRADTEPHTHNHTGGDEQLSNRELTTLIAELELQMHTAAETLEFERAAMLRDHIYKLRHTLADTTVDVPEWERARILSGENRRISSRLV